MPPGIAAGDLVGAWWNPTSLMTGLLAVGVAACLAAVHLTRDAERSGAPALTDAFRRRALAAGVLVGGMSPAGRSDSADAGRPVFRLSVDEMPATCSCG